MRELAKAISRYLEQEVRSRLLHQDRTELVFVGPPRAALEEVFAILTANGSSDWQLQGAPEPAVVLLVDGETAEGKPEHCLSARSSWDYALTIRNGARVSVILATPSAWDNLPESIENASELLGRPRADSARAFTAAAPWPYVLECLESHFSISKAVFRKLFRDVFVDSRTLETERRESLPWLVADDMLNGANVALAAGLPAASSDPPTSDDLRVSRTSLIRLAKACGDEGLESVEAKLVDARTELRELDERVTGSPSNFVDDGTALPSLFSYLRKSAGSGNAFERAPTWFFRVDPATETWWPVLAGDVLDRLLDTIESRRSHGKLRLLVTTVVATPRPREPVLVQGEARLEVVEVIDGRQEPAPEASFLRRYPSANEIWDKQPDGVLVDDDIPEHDHPITYSASLAGYRPARVKMLSLDNFECRGHARILKATSNPPPSRPPRQGGPFEQEITVATAGRHDLAVHVASDVAAVQVLGRESVNSTLTI